MAVSSYPDIGLPDTGFRPYSSEWYHSLKQLLGESGCRQLGFFELPDSFLLSVVVPVYNESDSLRALLERVCSVPIRKEIIAVNDASTDDSEAILHDVAWQRADDPLNSFRIESHSKNSGKGAALRTGFSLAQGSAIIIQDADLEYDPYQYPRLLQPIIEGKADVVFGSRFLGDQPHRVLYFWHSIGNRVLTTLSNCFTNLNLTDMETCYKAFSHEALQGVLPALCQNRFGFEPEVTAKVARRSLRVFEISVSYSGRTYEQGKKITWRDGLQALWCIVRYGIMD